MSAIPEAVAPSGAQDLALRFHGTAAGYFRIWAVNLCLTLLTLGIFSAWAKVRKKRYFYSHTELDGTPFQYLGEPIPILKGRLIAVALFLVYYISSHFFVGLLPFIAIAAVLLAPWVISRAASFNARYSAFRNMTFSFDAGYLDTAKVLYWWGLLPAAAIALAVFASSAPSPLALAAGAVLLVGLCFPWWLAGFRRFLVARTAFGGEHASTRLSGWQLFGVYFMAGLVLILFGAIGGGASFVLALGGSTFGPVGGYAMLVFVYAGYVIGFAYVQARSGNFLWNQAKLGPLRFRSTLRARDLASLYVTNAVAIVVSLGLLTPWAVIRTLRYRAERLAVSAEGDLARLNGGPEHSAVAAAGAEVGDIFDLDISL